MDTGEVGKNDCRNRQHVVTFRLTGAEFAELKKKAEATISGEVSGYIRTVITGKKVQVVYRDRSMDGWVQEMSLLRKELNALGNNFNQVTKKVNATAGRPSFAFWVEQAITLQKELVCKVGIIKERIEKFVRSGLQNIPGDNIQGGTEL